MLTSIDFNDEAFASWLSQRPDVPMSYSEISDVLKHYIHTRDLQRVLKNVSSFQFYWVRFCLQMVYVEVWTLVSP